MFFVGYLIEADFGNNLVVGFGCPQDLLKYMQEEGFTSVVVTGHYFTITLSALSLSIEDVMRWSDGHIDMLYTY